MPSPATLRAEAEWWEARAHGAASPDEWLKAAATLRRRAADLEAARRAVKTPKAL